MEKYKVLIQITKVDESTGHCLDLGPPYEAGEFKTEIEARKLVENELMIIKPADARLRQACREVLDDLDVGGEQSRAFAEEIQILKDALSEAPTIKSECPNCGAGSNEREFKCKDLIDTEVIHMHYICEKCGNEIVEVFTLIDIYIDNSK